MKRGNLLLLLALPALLVGPPVTAQEPPEDPYTDNDVGDHLDPEVSAASTGRVTTILGTSGSVEQPDFEVVPAAGGGVRVVSNVVTIAVPVVDRVPEPPADAPPPADPPTEGPRPGDLCQSVRWITVRVGDEDYYLQMHEKALEVELSDLGVNGQVIPECPDLPPADADETDLAGMVEQMVRRLPVAAPRVSPPTAVTGLDAYLETNRPLEVVDRLDGAITVAGVTYPVDMAATGTFEVDWGQQDQGPEGDPAFQQVTTGHTSPGRGYDETLGPAASGAITHVYTSVPSAPIEVTVTDTWVITYDIAGVVEGGVLSVRVLPQSVPVEVVEYQAVLQN